MYSLYPLPSRLEATRVGRLPSSFQLGPQPAAATLRCCLRETKTFRRNPRILQTITAMQQGFTCLLARTCVTRNEPVQSCFGAEEQTAKWFPGQDRLKNFFSAKNSRCVSHLKVWNMIAMNFPSCRHEKQSMKVEAFVAYGEDFFSSLDRKSSAKSRNASCDT